MISKINFDDPKTQKELEEQERKRFMEEENLLLLESKVLKSVEKY